MSVDHLQYYLLDTLVKLTRCFLLGPMGSNEIHERTGLRCSYNFLEALK